MLVDVKYLRGQIRMFRSLLISRLCLASSCVEVIGIRFGKRTLALCKPLLSYESRTPGAGAAPIFCCNARAGPTDPPPEMKYDHGKA